MMYRPSLRQCWLVVVASLSAAASGSVGQQSIANNTSIAVPQGQGRCARDDRSSEICAAWASADAARQAITLNWWQLLLSAGGFAGLLYSLYLTRKATIAALEAAKEAETTVEIAERNALAAAELASLARANGQAELRCYLDITKAELVGDKGKDTEGEKCAGIRVEISNFGRTPASDVELTYAVSAAPRVGGKRETLDKGPVSIGMISPSDHCGATIWLRMANQLWQDVWDKKCVVEISTSVSYKDVFGDQHSLKMDLESSNPKHFAVMEGTRQTA